ncbi:39S ribosomal protein L13, mitochondrial [Apis mellifera caucasica]|uniref:39S ribosomal protein L13, mitochondrial n=1 Tax=Apis mellifera TaxID=7460 RepID=A0A7M7R7D6_APIME|nr:39S ribosomal protein L13, mitochondrial [Apis mellifera]KAG6804326.1 39S ribosomal protein L13, mitochondrial [Apis mellifera caucasica]KAG9435025.1 39S ribosomal protein L13, mitochondrial [Apis mellifera carnica]|eukprot:XP_397367.1 39S ribosomal protein L13, mitochondrial [Apis mellifera]
MSLLRKGQHWGTFSIVWHIFDATWQDPFQSAPLIKKYLMGLYKPIYHPLNKCGDHVIIINSKDIALRGNEWQKRVYFHHTTYIGGASWTLAWELHSKDPTLIFKKAIYSAMDGNLQRRYTMERLHIFPDENVPEDMLQNVSNQIKQLRPVPVKLCDISQEERDKIPRLIKYPIDYQLK